jgi:hypothetical protein
MVNFDENEFIVLGKEDDRMDVEDLFVSDFDSVGSSLEELKGLSQNL